MGLVTAMNSKEKKLLTGLVLVGVGLVVLAATYPNQTRQVANALKNRRAEQKPETVITEDVDYVEVYDVEPIDEEPIAVVVETHTIQKKWYEPLMFWRWGVWNRFKIR